MLSTDRHRQRRLRYDDVGGIEAQILTVTAGDIVNLYEYLMAYLPFYPANRTRLLPRAVDQPLQRLIVPGRDFLPCEALDIAL